MEVILYVKDMNAQVGFYRDGLGLEIIFPKVKSDYGAESWVTFDTGACILALHRGGKKRIGDDAPKIVFRVNDVAAMREEVLRKGVQLGEIRNPAPGVRVVDGVDPEGNKFSIESQES